MWLFLDIVRNDWLLLSETGDQDSCLYLFSSSRVQWRQEQRVFDENLGSRKMINSDLENWIHEKMVIVIFVIINKRARYRIDQTLGWIWFNVKIRCLKLDCFCWIAEQWVVEFRSSFSMRYVILELSSESLDPSNLSTLQIILLMNVFKN